MTAAGGVRRDGDALVFTGALLRDAVPALWKQASPSSLDGVRRIDLSGVDGLDSAGLALLAELTSRIASRSGSAATIVGAPTGLAELRAAYRLGDSLSFASAA